MHHIVKPIQSQLPLQLLQQVDGLQVVVQLHQVADQRIPIRVLEQQDLRIMQEDILLLEVILVRIILLEVHPALKPEARNHLHKQDKAMLEAIHQQEVVRQVVDLQVLILLHDLLQVRLDHPVPLGPQVPEDLLAHLLDLVDDR